MRRFDHLIVGNSAAGIGAVEGLRTEALETSICIISEENTPTYSRPFLGHLIDGSRDLKDLWYRSNDFYEKRSVDLLKGRRAVKLDVESKEVEIEGGERIGFGKMLIATGGSPIVPSIPGLSQSSHTFVKLSDAMGIDEKLNHGEVSSVVVLGGGLIGMTATSALVERGVEVTVVELAPRILSTVIDEEASAIIQNILDEKGARTITGHTISRVEGGLERPVAVIDNGERIEVDIIVVAIGVRPRVELAQNTKIAVDKGILVNRRMETTVPGIFAAGDCVQIYDSVRQKNMVLALWPTAYMGGRVAGRNMAGYDEEMEWTTSMNSMNFFGRSVLSAGIVSTFEGEGWTEMVERDEESYRKILIHENVIKGFVLVGNVKRAGLYLQMMKAGTRVSKLQESLLHEDFGLIHLPTRERRRMLKEAIKVAGS